MLDSPVYPAQGCVMPHASKGQGVERLLSRLGSCHSGAAELEHDAGDVGGALAQVERGAGFAAQHSQYIARLQRRADAVAHRLRAIGEQAAPGRTCTGSPSARASVAQAASDRATWSIGKRSSSVWYSNACTCRSPATTSTWLRGDSPSDRHTWQSLCITAIGWCAACSCMRNARSGGSGGPGATALIGPRRTTREDRHARRARRAAPGRTAPRDASRRPPRRHRPRAPRCSGWRTACRARRGFRHG